MPRRSRKRGEATEKRGLSAEQIPVLVVRDRNGGHFDSVLPATDKATLGVLLLSHWLSIQCYVLMVQVSLRRRPKSKVLPMSRLISRQGHEYGSAYSTFRISIRTTHA